MRQSDQHHIQGLQPAHRGGYHPKNVSIIYARFIPLSYTQNFVEKFPVLNSTGNHYSITYYHFNIKSE